MENNFEQNLNISKSEILEEANKMLSEACDSKISPNLKTLLATQEKLKKLKSSEIRFSAPIIRHGDHGIIFKNTINLIQGQAGSHKSRLAEIICATLLKQPYCQKELL